MKTFGVLLSLALLGTSAWAAIPPDASGNGLLQGNYYFRQVAYSSFDQSGSIGEATSVYGTINFDGKGNYTVTAQIMDTGQSAPQAYNVTGTYTIGANGKGLIDSPLIDGESVEGLVSNGVFVGSSTESQYVNDMLVAVSAGSAQPTNATLNGNYWVASFAVTNGDPGTIRDGFFSMNANGSGTLTPSIAVTGYIGSSGSTIVNQTLQGSTYTFTNGVGSLTFPLGNTASAQALVSGTKVTYVSPDGNLFVGGSSNGYDMVVGIRAATGTVTNQNFQGLYYVAGINEDVSDLANQYAQVSTFYGALSANGNGTIIEHQRICPFDQYSYDYTISDTYSLKADGSYDDTFQHYAVGINGLGFVGIGDGPYLGITIGLKSPSFSGSGVYLNPTGIVNAASYAPFTYGVARGELLTLYGTNLAPSTAVSPIPFTTLLNGVQVLVNNRPAPIYYVSPGQVSVIVPYATEYPSYVQFQVVNNGTSSNVVTTIMNQTSPGVFTSTQNGVGTGAALHADFSLVTAANPAKKGETILLYVTGLGDVSPAVADGTAGPSSPLSVASNEIDVYIDGETATVSYAGLAPGFAGLYQLNVVVPNTATSGEDYLDISGPDSYTTQATISVQ